MTCVQRDTRHQTQIGTQPVPCHPLATIKCIKKIIVIIIICSGRFHFAVGRVKFCNGSLFANDGRGRREKFTVIISRPLITKFLASPPATNDVKTSKKLRSLPRSIGRNGFFDDLVVDELVARIAISIIRFTFRLL